MLKKQGVSLCSRLLFPFQVVGKCTIENELSNEIKIVRIRAPVAEHTPCEIATFAAYVVVSCTSTLRNCLDSPALNFVVRLRERYFFGTNFFHFSFGIRVLSYSKIGVQYSRGTIKSVSFIGMFVYQHSRRSTPVLPLPCVTHTLGTNRCA